MYSISLLYGIITSCELLYMTSLKEHRDCLVAGFPVLSSPQWEGPLFVAAQPAAVDSGRARHSVQVMRAVGQCGNPLTVPLCLLFPTNNHRHTDVLSTSNYLFRDLAQQTEFVSGQCLQSRLWWRYLR